LLQLLWFFLDPPECLTKSVRNLDHLRNTFSSRRCA
jgi:hypothetical protein